MISLSVMRPMKYCDFIKCQSQTIGRGCSMAMSGESCYTIYGGEPESKDDIRMIAYEIYLEEFRAENQSYSYARTFKAREMVSEILKFVRENGCEAIFSDTDSILIKTIRAEL